jgi:hypothetical protein
MKYDKRLFVEFSKHSVSSTTAHLYARLILNLYYIYRLDINQDYISTKNNFSQINKLVKAGALSSKYVSAWNKLIEFKRNKNVN